MFLQVPTGPNLLDLRATELSLDPRVTLEWHSLLCAEPPTCVHGALCPAPTCPRGSQDACVCRTTRWPSGRQYMQDIMLAFRTPVQAGHSAGLVGNGWPEGTQSAQSPLQSLQHLLTHRPLSLIFALTPPRVPILSPLSLNLRNPPSTFSHSARHLPKGRQFPSREEFCCQR